MVYIHIQVNFGISKLSLESTRATPLGYFRKEDYKLLDQRMDAIYKLWNVIFKEKITHIVSQHTPLVFNNKDNLLKYRPRNKLIVNDLANEYNCNNTKSIAPSLQKIVPRPIMLLELYKEMVERPVSRVDVEWENNNVIDEKEKREDLPLVIKKTYWKH